MIQKEIQQNIHIWLSNGFKMLLKTKQLKMNSKKNILCVMLITNLKQDPQFGVRSQGTMIVSNLLRDFHELSHIHYYYYYSLL